MKKNKVLYITYDGINDQLGASQIIPYLNELKKSDYEFSVLSLEKNVSESIQSEHKHYPLQYRNNVPVISSYQNYINLKNKAHALLKENFFNATHCRSYIPALVGLHLKKIYSIPFIFDMRGFWADERVEAGIWNTRNPIYKYIYHFFKKKEKKLLIGSDAIIVLTNKAKEDILNRHPAIPESKIYVIPCCTDLHLFNTTSLTNSNNQFVLGYQGSIGTWYMLEEMLDFFKELKNTIPDAEFHFVTKQDPSIIINAARNKNIAPQSIKISSAERKDMPSAIQQFSAGLFFIRPTYSKTASSPTKAAEILACGIPIITNTGIGDMDNIINKHQCGIIIKEFTKAEYCNAIGQLNNLLKKDSKELRAVAEKEFSLQTGAAIYATVYSAIIK